MEHPADRLIGVVRYAPDPEGRRQRLGVRYRRLYHFEEQEQFLRSSHPLYLAYDPVFNAVLQSVPTSTIRCIHDPRLRLRQLAESFPAEGVEADAVAFTGLIQRETGIGWSEIGITGSLLISLHVQTSDLDISVFGIQGCQKAYEALASLRGPQSDVQPLDPAGVADLYGQRGSDTPIPFEEFARVESKKICQGLFHGRPYFVRFIKAPNEAEVKYGSFRYAPLGSATITATISDNKEAIFTPCRYLVSDVRMVEGPRVPISEIVSFRGRFCEQAAVGESVKASGALERCDSISGHTVYRLLLGNSPRDAIQVCPSSAHAG
jgi:predicted nucleotidyltransferase